MESLRQRYGEGAHSGEVKLVELDYVPKIRSVDNQPLEGGVPLFKE